MRNEDKKVLTIKQWKEDDRPREKMMEKGKASLSDAELIAIIIGTGTTEESAVALSKRILSRSDHNLNALASMSVDDLMTFRGIGKSKAVSILTAMELGKRRSMEHAREKKNVNSSVTAFEIMQPFIGDLLHEEFWILFLNNANRLLGKSQLSKGGIHATLVDVRLIFKKAISTGATSIILCHNHPSGNLTPSHSDIQLTKKIIKGGELLDIKVLDHIIVSQHGYFSFADENRM